MLVSRWFRFLFDAFGSSQKCRWGHRGQTMGTWPGACPAVGPDANAAAPEGETGAAPKPGGPGPGIGGGRPPKVHRHPGKGPLLPRDGPLNAQLPGPNLRKPRASSGPRHLNVSHQPVLQTMSLLETGVDGMCTRR